MRVAPQYMFGSVSTRQASRKLSDSLLGSYRDYFICLRWRIILRHVLGMDLKTDESAVFHTGHLIYGLALGAWIGSRHE